MEKRKMAVKTIYLTNENPKKIEKLEDCRNLSDLQSYIFQEFKEKPITEEVMEEISGLICMYLDSKKIKYKNMKPSILTGTITFECRDEEEL